MELDIEELKRHFYDYLELLIDGKEDSIVVSKNGVPVIQLVPLTKKNSKRVGIAKKEMKCFDLSLEDLNSIPINDFN